MVVNIDISCLNMKPWHTSLNRLEIRKIADDKLVKLLNGLNKSEADGENIHILKILELLSIDDTIWALQSMYNSCDRNLILFSCDCAELVLPIFDKNGVDKTPALKSIQAGRDLVNGTIDVAEARRINRKEAHGLARCEYAKNYYNQEGFGELFYAYLACNYAAMYDEPNSKMFPNLPDDVTYATYKALCNAYEYSGQTSVDNIKNQVKNLLIKMVNNPVLPTRISILPSFPIIHQT